MEDNIMVKEKQNVPLLRFPEFSGEWVENRLDEICEINPRSKTLPDNFIYIDLESVVGGCLLKEAWVTNDNAPSRAQRLLKFEDIIYQTVRPYQKNNYFFDKISSDYVASTGYAQLRAHINAKFIYQYIHTELFVNKVLLRCTGTSYPAINSSDLAAINLSYPINLAEQTKIADFLSVIDERIDLLTQKKKMLETYKKGVMQKLFSQELRFKNENGNNYPDWQEKTSGKIANIRRGASPRPINDKKWFDNNSSVGWVRISDVTKSKKYLLKTEQYLSQEGINKSRLIKKDNIIMSICATIGKPIYTLFDVCIHDGFVVFSELTQSKEFLYYFLEKIQKNWYRYGQPGTQVNLNVDIISSEIISLPSLAEQQKIANFLSAIDDKITVLNDKIDSSQLYKKGLLQQMFV